MYRNILNDFGWLGNLDSVKRRNRINEIKSEIRKYPFSYFLLRSISYYKEQYSKGEIKTILSLFDEPVQQSSLGKEIRDYLSVRPNPNEPVPNLVLLNSENRRGVIIDKGAKLNILVFWASWCGPCRKEIPLLKEINTAFKDKGVRLVSISIDDNPEQWKKAMLKEKMSWPQYIVATEELKYVKQKFNFAAIPLVVFTDGNGNELKRFLGNDGESSNLYMKFIKERIK